MSPIRLALDPAVRPLVRIAWIRAEPIRVAPAGAELRRETSELCERTRARHAGREPAQIAELAPARELYRSFGIDPTRTRPSSEALLRRVLRGLSFPAISNAVDLGNHCSLRFLVPVGLFDAERIEGDVTLRRGLPGEAYPGIRKDEVHLEGRPVLADARGAFGNPTSDSARTAVSTTTRSLWMTLFATPSAAHSVLAERAGVVAALMARHLAGPEEVRTATGVVG